MWDIATRFAIAVQLGTWKKITNPLYVPMVTVRLQRHEQERGSLWLQVTTGPYLHTHEHTLYRKYKLVYTTNM